MLCFLMIPNYLITESEVMTGKSQTDQYGIPWSIQQVKVWDFPIMIKQSRLLSCLLYGTKQQYIKKVKASAAEVISSHPVVRAQACNRPVGIMGE